VAEAERGILLISCIDRSGIIARVAGQLLHLGCNIITSDQHTDDADGHFFWRIDFESRQFSLSEVAQNLTDTLPRLLTWEQLQWHLYDSSRHDRMVIMVSRLAHCMMDLLSRYRFGELEAEVVAVISNHPDLEPLARPFGVPFDVIPVTKDKKPEAEARLLERLVELKADTVVLARYMQVLSGDFLRKWQKPIVNIHHGFLPAFAGASPYRQAHDRGVKLIGATAHYVTEELDAGPIIAQATTAITHRDTIADLARRGKDLEVVALAKAVRAHLHKQVLIHHNRTIVFE